MWLSWGFDNISRFPVLPDIVEEVDDDTGQHVEKVVDDTDPLLHHCLGSSSHHPDLHYVVFPHTGNIIVG